MHITYIYIYIYSFIQIIVYIYTHIYMYTHIDRVHAHQYLRRCMYLHFVSHVSLNVLRM